MGFTAHCSGCIVVFVWGVFINFARGPVRCQCIKTLKTDLGRKGTFPVDHFKESGMDDCTLKG